MNAAREKKETSAKYNGLLALIMLERETIIKYRK